MPRGLASAARNLPDLPLRQAAQKDVPSTLHWRLMCTRAGKSTGTQPHLLRCCYTLTRPFIKRQGIAKHQTRERAGQVQSRAASISRLREGCMLARMSAGRCHSEPSQPGRCVSGRCTRNGRDGQTAGQTSVPVKHGRHSSSGEGLRVLVHACPVRSLLGLCQWSCCGRFPVGKRCQGALPAGGNLQCESGGAGASARAGQVPTPRSRAARPKSPAPCMHAPTSIFLVRSRCPFSLPVAASCVRKCCSASGLMFGREESTPAAAELQARGSSSRGEVGRCGDAELGGHMPASGLLAGKKHPLSKNMPGQPCLAAGRAP